MIFEFTHLENSIKVSLREPMQDPYVLVNNGRGAITKHVIGDIRIRLGMQRIDVEYIPQLVDIAENVLSVQPIVAFAATTQENWAYFYEPSRNGEQTEKMVINGLLQHLFNIICFDPATGEFVGVIDLTPQPEPEPVAEEPTPAA